ncbi:MAG: hypothetical protein M3P18_18045 [Actinomycetota bacterium]|nr:hypothetical protein [Actinomycetota bacterium]
MSGFWLVSAIAALLLLWIGVGATETGQLASALAFIVALWLALRTVFNRQAQRVKHRGIVFKEPKWHSKRTLALPEVTERALRAHRLKQTAERLRVGSAWVDLDLVFTTGIGTAISASNLVNRNFKPLLLRAGLPRELRFQDLRHSAATLLLAQGVPLRVVSDSGSLDDARHRALRGGRTGAPRGGCGRDGSRLRRVKV